MFLSPNVRVDRLVDSFRILSYYVVFVERSVHTRRVFGMVCWLSLIYLRIEELAEGGWIFFSLVRASKTWANIVMAIQPGYRLLMSLDSTTSSFASDLTADSQWSFALYALCVTIRYIYLLLIIQTIHFILFTFSKKYFFCIISRTTYDLRTHGTYYRYRTVKFIQRKINSARRLRVTRMLVIRWIELDERNGWKKYRGRDFR